jgi:hypothetical protein
MLNSIELLTVYRPNLACRRLTRKVESGSQWRSPAGGCPSDWAELVSKFLATRCLVQHNLANTASKWPLKARQFGSSASERGIEYRDVSAKDGFITQRRSP